MRGLCVSFTSSCFLFPVIGGVKCLRNEGEGVKNLRTAGRVTNFGGISVRGRQYPITWQVLLPLPLSHSQHLSSLQYPVLQYSSCKDKVFSYFSFTHHILNLAFVSNHF